MHRGRRARSRWATVSDTENYLLRQHALGHPLAVSIIPLRLKASALRIHNE